ncbi:MAG: hypothetical protein IJP10_05310 [Clostridia bacterium]|nr:hypothetical protein [Clostridia bacterium]
MKVCTFFGHRDTPKEIEPILRSILIGLIENKDVSMFYVGNNGRFDEIVRRVIISLKLDYPNINYAVVIAYMPKKNEYGIKDYSDTIYPEGFENTPPKYAICKRNRWMLSRSDYVVTYVNHTYGGAAQYKALSEKMGKTVINICL